MDEQKNADGHPNVARFEQVRPGGFGRGSKFGHTSKRLGNEAGSKSLGCSWYEVAPGKAAFPAHYHCAIEEAIYVLEGEGTLRIGKDNVQVHAGDYIALPTGPDHAHRLDNTGSAPLRYLCMSCLTAAQVEVVGYPDSGKLAFSAGSRDEPIARMMIRNGVETKDYFEGEEID